MFKYVKDDGGRKAANFKGSTGDCVTRAIAIATKQEYRVVYDALTSRIKDYIEDRRKNGRLTKREARYSVRTGVPNQIARPYLESLGWTFVFTKGKGVYFDGNHLPKGRLVVWLARHYAAVVNHEYHDTHDYREGGLGSHGDRVVRGYFYRADDAETA